MECTEIYQPEQQEQQEFLEELEEQQEEPGQQEQEREREHTVVIVGAGITGISAARTFYELSPNTKVIILEARNRYGGRVSDHLLTRNLTSADETGDTTVKINPGANWIHGLCESNPIYQFARILNLALHETSSDNCPGDDILLFDCPKYNINVCLGEAEGEEDSSGTSLKPIPLECYKQAIKLHKWIKRKLDDYPG